VARAAEAGDRWGITGEKSWKPAARHGGWKQLAVIESNPRQATESSTRTLFRAVACPEAVAAGALRRQAAQALSRGQQVADGSDRHDIPGCRREARVNRDQGVSLQPGDREVLGLPEVVPVVLSCELPCGAARHPVTEQPHLYRGHPLVCFQGRRFGALAGADVTQQQLKRLGADRVRRDQVVGRMDLKPGVHEVEQSRRVDHVSGHRLSLTGTVSAAPGHPGANLRSAPAGCRSTRT
jgi:hypothetical protein